MSAPDKVTEKAIESAKAFLSGVFMGLRTLQIHDANNRAVENAVRTTYEAASALYSATGGFKIQFVDATVFLNGTRVKFDAGMFNSLRMLESALRAKQVGGFSMSQPPSFEALKALIAELASEGEVKREALGSFSIDTLGLQAFGEQKKRVAIDSRVLAVQSYAKLILALREQFKRIRRERAEGKSAPVRLRVVRILQDLVELVAERPDYLLRLSTNNSGAPAEELHGVNTAMLSLVMGQAVGLPRRDLVDLAMGALFHHIGALEPNAILDRNTIDMSSARMFAEGGVSRSSLLRAMVVAHQRKRADGRAKFRPQRPHLLARLTGVASAYSQMVSGYGTKNGSRASPLDALQILMLDEVGRFDPDAVDLLINVLRAFPAGCRVVLDNGKEGIVAGHPERSRWDRPVVTVDGRNIDLMAKEGDRFHHRVAATARFLAHREQPVLEQLREESPLLDAVLAEENRATPPPAPRPKEDMDALFKEFLAEDKKAKPKIDTSYSSKTRGERGK